MTRTDGEFFSIMNSELTPWIEDLATSNKLDWEQLICLLRALDRTALFCKQEFFFHRIEEIEKDISSLISTKAAFDNSVILNKLQSLIQEITEQSKNKIQSNRIIAIQITTGPGLFKTGIDILMMFQELQNKGKIHISAQEKIIPSWKDFNPNNCYLNWHIQLESSVSLNEIKDSLIFLECDPETKITYQEKELTNISEMPALTADFKTANPVKQKTDSDSATIRVAGNKLDHVLDLVGELVTTQAKLNAQVSKIANPGLENTIEDLGRLVDELRDNTMKLRMQPIKVLFRRFNRLVYDLAMNLGKEVDLILEGEETEFDKTVVEKLYDPLVHLVRNSLDHGIETPETRVKAGKTSRGVLSFSAYQSGSEVVICVQDDGKGLDAAIIQKKALEKGLIQANDILTEGEIHRLIFLPGFSTAQQVSQLSGRGVGMDVVKSNVESLRGQVDISSVLGKGTKIQLRFPLTLAIIDGLSIKVAQETYIFPLSLVEECLDMRGLQLEKQQGFFSLRGQAIPFIRLRQFVNLPTGASNEQMVLVRRSGQEKVGIVVDQILGQNQTVVKPLGIMHAGRKEFSGSTILGDGTVALIFDVAYLIEAYELTGQGKLIHGAKEEICLSASN